jgi:hypothetical protein
MTYSKYKCHYLTRAHEWPVGSAELESSGVLDFRARANELPCADFKREFMLADRRYCYP